jgi:hypothetical protein
MLRAEVAVNNRYAVLALWLCGKEYEARIFHRNFHPVAKLAAKSLKDSVKTASLTALVVILQVSAM